MKDLNEKEFARLLEEVEELTNDNCHSEALLEVADFFGYLEYRMLFDWYSKLDGLTMEASQSRYLAQVRMLNAIQLEYGSRPVRLLNSCL